VREALHETEEMFRLFMNYSPIYVFFKDENIRAIQLSKNYEKMLGRPVHELIGKTMNELFPSELAKSMVEDDLRILREGKPVEVMEELHGRFYTTTKFPITREGKSPLLAGFTIDITDHKRAEEQTQDALNYIRTMMESSPIGIVSFKASGDVVAANEAVARMMGGTVEQLLKQNVRELEAWKKYGFLSAAEEALATNGQKEMETYYVSTFGRAMWLAVRFVSFEYQGEPHVLLSLIDITARKRAEQEMNSLQEQLRQAQKMEAIGQLAGGVAHDFNNILTVIGGRCELTLRKLIPGDPLRGSLEEIKKAADRAASLTQQLLAFSRRQILEFKVLDLNTMVLDLDKMLRRVIGEDIELITLLGEDLGKVNTDPGQIEQVILNLAVNARDAMPEGGKIILETDNVELDEEYARSHVGAKPGPYVRLSVSDTGVGMTPEVRERIFEPFFTTKEMGKGTGLGLSTVYGIIKQSGGNIWVYSEAGHGTVFKIYFPRVDERVEVLEERVGGEAAPRGSETILLVEDEAEVRELAAEFLRRHGYRVLEARHGDDALMICGKHPESIDLMVTDVVMPRMSGRELARHLARLRPKTKVLYMSGYTDNAIFHQSVLEKGLNFIQKPFSMVKLAKKVRDVLDRHSERAV
jgi:PAS domain S-box-containing protein